MSWLVVATAGIANVFTYYPGFVVPDISVQAITDKGPVLEMVVSCTRGEGIMSYSKIDKVFCVPDATCYSSISPAIKNLCK